MSSTDNSKKLLSKIRAQAERLRVLNELMDIEATTKEKYQMLKELLLLTVKAIMVEQGFIILYKKESSSQFEYGATNSTQQLADPTLIRDICENIIRSRKPVIINDTRLHKRLRRCNIRNIIALPLLINKKTVGVFIIINKHKQLFKKRDLIIFSMICKFTSLAIEHANEFTELENKEKELSTINSIDRIRDTIKDFDNMMDAILNEITHVTNAKLAFFILYNKKTEKTDLKISGKLKSSVFVNKNAEHIYDISRQTLDKGELTEFSKISKDIYTAICAPLAISDEVMGVFGAINSEGDSVFTQVDKNLLTAIAKQSDSAVFEDLEKNEIKKAFQRYVSPEVMNEILEDPEKNYLSTDRKELTVLFSDIRGFTELSEKTDPETVVKILNEHFNAMSNIILKQRGTLDKFVGDEIMAIFGAPVYSETHALRAVRTAFEMQRAQEELSKKFKREYKIDISIGIGINTGDMVVGNIGCKDRMDYTVVGDSVNTAARLCSAAEAGQILISETTYAEVKKHVKVKELEPIKIKGKSKPVQLYNVIGLIRQ
jgi:class 3 adenylate cyclase/GAF domain-containing protein